MRTGRPRSFNPPFAIPWPGRRVLPHFLPFSTPADGFCIAGRGIRALVGGMFSTRLWLVLMALSQIALLASGAGAASGRATSGSAAKKRPAMTPRDAPNFLFIIADDLNDWVGWLGGHPQTRTPRMDALAQAGMRFSNAHCSYALCNPSRTSLLTGMLPSSSGVFGNEQDWRRSVMIPAGGTLPEHLRASGFLTAAGGKIFHANHGGPEGRLAGWHGGRRGFECDAAWDARFPKPGVQLADLPVHTGRNFNGLNIWHWDWGAIPVEDEATEDGQMTAWAAEFLSRRQQRPFFLALGLYRPHSPWYVPQKYLDLFPPEQIRLPEVKEDDLDDLPEIARSQSNPGSLHATIVAKGAWKDAVRGYLASIAFCDAMLGRVLDALAAGPNARNTVVIFTSDHGWYLGQKQMWHKGRLWEEATHVPLSILAPGVTTPGSASHQPVSLLDLYPTVCELARVKAPGHLDGESLVPLLRDPSLVRDVPVLTAMGGAGAASYAARTDRWRYIRYHDGTEELYDHQSDPREWRNLAAAAEHAALKQTLAAAFPREWSSACRSASEVVPASSPDGSLDYRLQCGDSLPPSAAPKIQGRGVYLDVAFDYAPEIDQDSTIIAQGDRQLGYALHLVAGAPTLTVYHQNKPVTLALSSLPPGRHMLRAMMGPDGLATLARLGDAEVSQKLPFEGGFPREPADGLSVGASFGILGAGEFPNSTPFDGAVSRVRLVVYPRTENGPSVVPAAIPVEVGAPANPAGAAVSPR